tara:strand:- start:476 stop:1852 length:1377 start_codon:yes stop_codon:yes gene_type:complete
MTKLSGLIGFGAGSGGAGDSRLTSFPDSIKLGSFSTDGTAQGYNFQDSNMDAYAQPLRIRGFDTSSDAFVAYNVSTRQSSSPGSGNHYHGLWLFSIDQTTGVPSFADYTSALSSNSPYDYSTFSRASDEWSGRYCYMGNIPRQSSPAHQQGYNAYKINWNGSSVSTSGTYSNNSSYSANGNSGEHSFYLEPSERRNGGAVTHICTGNSSGNAAAMEFRYSYSASSLSNQTVYNPVYTSSVTSTNRNVRHFWQWDQGSQPYYDVFHSMPNGILARTRGSNSWGIVQSGSHDLRSCVFHLSTGKCVLYYDGNQYLIDTSGTKTQITSNIVGWLGACRGASYGASTHAWNIGQDEWILNTSGGLWLKWKFDPNTGQLDKASQVIRSDDAFYETLDQNSHYKTGLRSQNLGYSHQTFTYGTNNSSGPGYGNNKLVYIGGTQYKLYVKTYDLQLIIDKLEYLS